MIRRAVPVLPNSCLSGVQPLINPLRGLAILDPRPRTVACHCERTHTLAGRPCYSLLLLGHSILSWGDQHGAIDRADEVTLSRKGAKRRKRITGLRSKTTKARTRVSCIREPRADLEKKLEDLERKLHARTREQQPVFDAMLANAARLCEAEFGTLYLCEGDALRIVAAHNVPSAFAEARRRGPFRPAPGGFFHEVLRN